MDSMLLINANSEEGFSLRVTVSVWSNGSRFIVVSITGRVQFFQHFSVETSCVSDAIREKRGREEEKDERTKRGNEREMGFCHEVEFVCADISERVKLPVCPQPCVIEKHLFSLVLVDKFILEGRG